jgi:hypothetical protein
MNGNVLALIRNLSARVTGARAQYERNGNHTTKENSTAATKVTRA